MTHQKQSKITVDLIKQACKSFWLHEIHQAIARLPGNQVLDQD